MPGFSWSFFMIEGVRFNRWATSAPLLTFFKRDLKVAWNVFMGYAWHDLQWFRTLIAAVSCSVVELPFSRAWPALLTCFLEYLGVVKAMWFSLEDLAFMIFYAESFSNRTNTAASPQTPASPTPHHLNRPSHHWARCSAISATGWVCRRRVGPHLGSRTGPEQRPKRLAAFVHTSLRCGSWHVPHG